MLVFKNGKKSDKISKERRFFSRNIKEKFNFILPHSAFICFKIDDWSGHKRRRSEIFKKKKKQKWAKNGQTPL